MLPPVTKADEMSERYVSAIPIEKDFWVCWTLKRLFGLQEKDAATLVFKGGTSLSEAFGAIRRFSEDIDLSFDRAELGYTGDRDPEKEGISKKQANKLIEALVGDVERHIAEKLLPALRSAIVEGLDHPAGEAGARRARGGRSPTEQKIIHPYATADFPDFFKEEARNLDNQQNRKTLAAVEA
ncbi:nucleotidyl transferase AbiEii/AbiGii toxin family protein (plasmid) [Rhizobium sp. 007]|nr:nucleotidyl transferase AbiEii/AbiGii toxin family protein [Rhizobium sp. 007]